MQAAKSIHPMDNFFSAPFFAGPVLEAYTSFTTRNHPMKRYNWSVWWEEARCMCDADRFSIGFRFHENTPLPQGLRAHKINGICLGNLPGQAFHPPLEAVSILAHHLPSHKANNCQRLHLHDWSATCFDTWLQSWQRSQLQFLLCYCDVIHIKSDGIRTYLGWPVWCICGKWNLFLILLVWRVETLLHGKTISKYCSKEI